MSKQDSVGVIVARFQVPKLSPGHRHLINIVRAQHEKVLIVLGLHGGERTSHDPLTFDERVDMIRESYPRSEKRVLIAPLRDHPFSTDRWSVWLDELIVKTAGREADLYGSRRGFLGVYTGSFPGTYVPTIASISGTDMRKYTLYSRKMSGREAIIYTQQTRHPIAYSANDIAVLDEINQRVLLGTKDWFDGKWAILGGFLDPELDKNDFMAAGREKGEEVLGVNAGELRPLGDRFRVDDPRYRKGHDKTFSRLFACTYLGGDPVGADDIKTVRWFDRQELRDVIAPWHMPHVDQLEAYWSGRKAA